FVEAAYQADHAARIRPHRRRADRIALGMAKRHLIGRGERSRDEEKASDKNRQPHALAMSISRRSRHSLARAAWTCAGDSERQHISVCSQQERSSTCWSMRTD